MTGQLGYDVIKELARRGHEAIGSGGRAGEDMKVFVTGVGGQLGHDVVNELEQRSHEGVGSDIQESYSGIADGTAVTTVPYVQLDIKDKVAVKKVIDEIRPDAIVHCAAVSGILFSRDSRNKYERNSIHC